MLSKKLKAVFDKYNGTLPTKVAVREGISKETLRKAALRGDIEKVDRSGYVLLEALQDDYFLLQSAVPKGIISHESAAMFLNYGNFSPFECHMTFPHGYNNPNLNKHLIRPKYVSSSYYDLGVTKLETWHGNLVFAYDRERTVLDMLASRHSSAETVERVLDDYFYDDEKDLSRLYEYAEKMNRLYCLKEVNLKIA
ncbi:hypothetical protein IGI37_000602 [Enterococcus sp. AZ194]|uniref:type IV toxin-antitoxin system AbiEi family antitoxin domain-containing protein n=1 Tax=Enterococcus sp. AZ194 TaxID=2774629 RepID=UPI003F1EED98